MHFTSVEELHYTAATVNAGNNRISICKSVVTPKVTHNPAHFKVNLNKNILACMITCSIVMWILLKQKKEWPIRNMGVKNKHLDDK